MLVEDYGADVNARCSKLQTPLHAAAVKGYGKVCRMLLRNGADSAAQNINQETTLQFAARGGNAAIGRMLIDDYGADVSAKDDVQCTAVHRAALSGCIEFFHMLVNDYGADANARESTQYIPLHLAAQNGHLKLCRVMIEEYGNNVNATGKRLYTPLHCAAQHPSDQMYPEETHGEIAGETCRMLVEDHGADVNAMTDEQVTPLHMAAHSGYTEVCKSLVLVGANLRALDSDNSTPSAKAREMGYTDLASHLRPGGGAHYLRCTGPSLERVLIWNDTPETKKEEQLHKMEVQWLARVAEGCSNARVGLTLRGMHNGELPTRVLLQIMRFVVMDAHLSLSSCISTSRYTSQVPSEGGKDKSSESTPAGSGADQEQQSSPRLALVSHILVHQMATTTATEQVRTAAVLMTAARDTSSGDSGCMWLYNYCNFVLQRHEDGISCRRCGASRAAGMLRCSKCRGVRYCTRECQKADWKQHKHVCVDIAKHDGANNELLDTPLVVDATTAHLPPARIHGSPLARLQQYNTRGALWAMVALILGTMAYFLDTKYFSMDTPSIPGVLAISTVFLLFAVHVLGAAAAAAQ
jgi:ankyrin repeat protein